MPTGGLISVSYNEYFPLPGVGLSGLDFPTGPRALVDGELPPESGVFDAELPLSLLPYSTVAGGMVTSYFDDYYNRIFIEPASVDFGAITDDVTQTINVWNAYYRQTVTLESIGIDTYTGLTISGITLPAVFTPLEAKVLTLSASLNGSAVIDTTLDWLFDAPFFFQMPVKGTRARLWNFEPNWPPAGQTYRISYEFLTEIIVSRSGREQRIALRQNPRKNLSHNVMLNVEGFREFKDLMWSWQARAFILPELTRYVDSTVATVSGESTVELGTVPAWIVSGTLLQMNYLGQREVREVESTTVSQVTFTAPSVSAWPAGSRLYLALVGTVATDLQAPRLTNAVASLDLIFNPFPLSEVWAEVGAADVIFNEREVFLKKPNWVQPLGSTKSHPVDDIDYSRGGVFRTVPIEFGTESRRAVYVNKSPQEAEELLDFYRRMYGRQGEFYMPTWEYDFVPKGTSSSGSTTLRVTGVSLAKSYGDSTVHKAVFIMLNSGTVLMRQVLSVAQVTDGDGEDSLITVDATWGTEISEDLIVMSGWMPVWRLASDALTFEWLTNRVAQVQLTMQTLEDLPPETA